MPTIPINQESPSVFDSLFEQVMKRMKPSTPDVNDIGGLMGPIGVPAGLISKIPFKEKVGRNLALKAHLQQKGLSPEVMQAVEFAQKKYPRLTAHLLDVIETPIDPHLPGRKTLAEFTGIEPLHGYTGRIKIDTDLVKKSKGVEGIADTIGHELTHAGQYLWKPEAFGSRYKAASEAVGYDNNPFEVGARAAGNKFKERMLYPAANVKLKKTPQEFGGHGTPSDSVIQKFLDMFNLSK